MNTVSILELKFRVGKVEELFSMRKGWTGREIDGRHRSQVMMQRGRVSVESSHDDPHQPRCSRLSPIPRTNIPTWSSRFRPSSVHHIMFGWNCSEGWRVGSLNENKDYEAPI